MPLGEGVAIRLARQELRRDLADRLEERQADLARELGHGFRAHERAPRERLDRAESVSPADDRLRRFEREAVAEARAGHEVRALSLGKELHGVEDGAAHRRMPPGAATAKDVERLAQPLTELPVGQEGHTGGGQLDGQWKALKFDHEVADGLVCVAVRWQVGSHESRALHEEVLRFTGRQGRQGPHLLPRDVERDPRGQEEPRLRRSSEPLLHQRRSMGDEVLEVVEHEEHSPAARDALRELPRGGVLARALVEPEAEGRRHDGGHSHRAFRLGEIAEPHAPASVRRVLAEQAVGEADRQACLADAARSHQRHQACSAVEASPEGLEIRRAPDEGREDVVEIGLARPRTGHSGPESTRCRAGAIGRRCQRGPFGIKAD